MTTPGALTFGAWLRQQRKDRDLTQEELGDNVGCSFEAIRKIEKGTRRPSRQMVEALCRYLRPAPEQWPDIMRLARLGPDAFRPIHQMRRRSGRG